ncbi:MAG: AsmA family protein [Alphaproteobacteria bacterium]|nr:AsmA family protein [Alphaproteobacteria bacterium]
MLKILKWTFAILSFLIGAAVIGLVIFISQFDLNEYKPQIEKLVYDQTGRKLELKGDIGIKISLVPTLETKDVVLENAAWAGKKAMVEIKEADVTLGILPLLNKKVEIEEINIIEPVVNLSMNTDGTGNWVFEKPAAEEAQENKEQSSEKPQNAEIKEEPSKSVDAAAAPLLAGFVAKKLYIENGVLNYEDLKSKSKTNLKITLLELASEDMDSQVNLKYDVNYNGQDIKGTAIGDSITTLLKNEPYKVVLSTKAYNANLKANAKLEDLMGDLKFNVSADILSPNGNFSLPKTSLIADVKGSLKQMSAAISKLDLGGNVITGNFNINLEGKKPAINGNIKSDLINVQTLKAEEKTAMFSVVSVAAAASFVPNEKLDLSALNELTANIGFDVKKLILNEDISLDNLKGTADIKNGILNIKPFSFVAGGGNVSGNASIEAKNNALVINLDGKDIVAQNFLKSLDPKNESTFGFKSGGKTDLHIALKSSGETYPNIVENLDGQVLLVVGQSQLQAGALKYLKGGFISQLLSALSIEAKDPKMSLKCAVLRADFKDGKAKLPKGIVFDSKKMMVVGDGDVNLKNDKINISIKPFNGNLTDTNIAQAISSLVKISGTVSKPSIAIDTASVVKNVVGVAMTGPAFIGSQLLLDADQAPCYTALKNTVYKDMFEAPTGVKAGAQNVYQGTSDLVEGGINLITGTAGNVVEGGTDMLGDAAKGMFNMLTGNSKKNKE